MTKRIEDDLAQIGLHLHRAEGIRGWDKERLFEPVPSVSKWSPGEHLFHLLLANELSLKNAESLAKRKGQLIHPFEERHPQALEVLGKGRLPRGEVEAPRFVRPPKNIGLGFLAELIQGNRDQIKGIAEDLTALESAPDTITHQLLGDLTAEQWIRFVHIHTAHHLWIIREIDTARRAGSPA